MDTVSHIASDEDENYIYPPQYDPLGVLTTTYPVVIQGEHVWINNGRIEDLALNWSQENAALPPAIPSWYERYHFFDGTERSVNWILALDAMNFCFWAEKDQPRWRVEYQGEWLNGYMAEAASLTRAIEDDIPLWDARYLNELTGETLAHIFRGEGSIPLFEQRLHNAREVGRVLLEHYDGQFTNAIKEAEYDAVRLALLLAGRFSSFNDVALYRGRLARFFKRAQICVSDLAGAFKGAGWGALANLDQLTAFADYKVPQVLRHFGILSYDPELSQHIDDMKLLVEGSEEEIEIRAATIWACELLRQRLLQHDCPLTASAIDMRLWLFGQENGEMRPYHRTRTQYY